MPVLTISKLNLLRTDGHRAKLYLSVSQPRTLLTAQVSGSYSQGDRAITFNNGQGSGFFDIEENHILKLATSLVTKTVRVRSISGSPAGGTVTVAGNSFPWSDNDNFEILDDFPLKPRPPRFTSSTFYKDWTDTYTDENLKPPPVCIAGPHRAKFLVGGQAVFNVDLTPSYAVAQGASIAGYGLSAMPSSGISLSFDTATGLGTATVTTAGQYWLSHTVTDSNGKSQTTKRRIWAHESDPTDADYPYTDLQIQTLQGDWERGGWALGITVRGTADTTAFPDEALICLWHEVDYGGTEAIIGQDHGILFCGYIRKGTVSADWENGTVSFEAETVQSILRNISMRSIPLQAVRSPSKWYEYPTWLTNGRALHHYWRYHSTLFEICDVYGLVDDATIYRAGVVFQKGDMYSQAENVFRENGICGHMVSNKAGQLHAVRDIQLLSDTDRAAKPTTTKITEADRVGQITVIDRPPFTVASSYVEGIYFDRANAEAICAKAPGHIPEDQGQGEANKRNQTLTGEAHAKSLAGRLLAVANNPYPEARVDFNGLWAGALDIVGDEWWQVDLSSDDTTRGIAWTDKKLVLRTVNSRHDPATGYIASSGVFEPEAAGPEGIIIPCIGLPDPPGPPTPKWEEPGLDALMAFSSASYRDDNADDWTELQTANYNGGAIDPWWRSKTSSNNPKDAIWWAVADGAVYRVEGTGTDVMPENRTPVTDPPNTWSDATAPTMADLEFIGPFPDRWIKNQWYVLARMQETGGDWRGWMAFTDDDGLRWSWVELYDGVSLPTQIKPIWLAVNGTYILTTIWENDASDTLRLLVFNSSMVYSTEFSLGAATLTEIDDRDYFAFPVAVLDNDDLWHVAGRMDAPAGLTGTQHIIKSANAGGAWSSVESDQGSGVISGLVVKLDNAGDRDYFAGVYRGVPSVPSPSTWSSSDDYIEAPITDGTYLYGSNPSWGSNDEIDRHDPATATSTLIANFGRRVGGYCVFKDALYAAYFGPISGTTYPTYIYKYSGSGTTWNLVHTFTSYGDGYLDLVADGTHIVCVTSGRSSAISGPYLVVEYSSDGSTWSTGDLNGYGETAGLDPTGYIVGLSHSEGTYVSNLTLAVPFVNGSSYIAEWSSPNMDIVYTGDQLDHMDSMFYWRDVGGNNYRSTDLINWAASGTTVEPIPSQNIPWSVGISEVVDTYADYWVHFWDPDVGDWTAGEHIGQFFSARSIRAAVADNNGNMWLSYCHLYGCDWWKRDNPIY